METAKEPNQKLPAEHGRAGRDLPVAIAVGAGLFFALVGTLAWWNWGFILILAIALSLGAIEVHNALERLNMHSAIGPIVIGTVAIVVGSYWAGARGLSDISSNTAMLGALGMTVTAALLVRLRGGSQGYVRDAAASLFIIAYIPLLGSFLALLLASGQGPRRIIAYLICIVASDTGGYAIGVLFGKHPMAPKISPKKTWEGLVGSLVFGTLAGILSVVFLLGAPWWVGLILGASMVLVGTAGDLVESMVKRDAGIKDMSSFLPGHGGVMDRLDSLLVAAPTAWLILYLLVPGS